MFYFVKTPWWLREFYHSYLWRMPGKDKALYLTFDDGPHPAVTSFVLEKLREVGAFATFFCIGKNVLDHPGLYERIVEEGHTVGNHSYSHYNGWKTDNEKYVNDVAKAGEFINSKLFRPPYGRIKSIQAKQLQSAPYNYKMIMWDVLSADFDPSVNADQCTANVILRAEPGSIIVYHDSEKAYPKLKTSLPEILEHFSREGFKFKSLPESVISE